MHNVASISSSWPCSAAISGADATSTADQAHLHTQAYKGVHGVDPDPYVPQSLPLRKCRVGVTPQVRSCAEIPPVFSQRLVHLNPFFLCHRVMLVHIVKREFVLFGHLHNPPEQVELFVDPFKIKLPLRREGAVCSPNVLRDLFLVFATHVTPGGLRVSTCLDHRPINSPCGRTARFGQCLEEIARRQSFPG